MEIETFRWADLVTVTVTFHPDFLLLQSQLQALPRDCLKLLVDNASSADAQRALYALCATVPNVHVVVNEANIGLAAALNQGVAFARHMRSSAYFLFTARSG
ncbi:glycosyltransferase [Candidatus Competibacter phosphatis]|uniref:glycosyltransferase n=1 Tax=Candidatus Competibacter phosphatis TaxID=221280 RepID=UPI001FE25905|nr:glycosyltransferase [Candidatus Competibacter phosphatis]